MKAKGKEGELGKAKQGRTEEGKAKKQENV